jgi:hypothetical protein
VYFIYPETANVRLEDMNALFGDATTALGTPASHASQSRDRGGGSPVPSLRLGEHGADSAIPGLDIEPPPVEIRDGKFIPSRRGSDASSIMSSIREQGEGLGGWISGMVNRNQNGESDGKGGKYKPVNDDEV